MKLSRRNILIGAGGAVVVAGAAFEGSHLLRKRYAPSPYDDLLALLQDRDGDAQLGEAVLAAKGNFDAAAVAAGLREKLKHGALAEVETKDAAEGRLVEARGWVLPEALADLCALAAKAAA